MSKINVLDNEISIYTINGEDYICITDIARYKDPIKILTILMI